VVGAVAAAAGTAVAAEQGTDSQITISPRTVVASAGQTSPVDVGGVRAVRAGKPIPTGYVLVGRHVKFTRGTEVGYGALTMRCPSGKTLRGLARQGQVGPQVVRDTHYPRQALRRPDRHLRREQDAGRRHRRGHRARALPLSVVSNPTGEEATALAAACGMRCPGRRARPGGLRRYPQQGGDHGDAGRGAG
jgi:hypothetical protein